MPLVLRNIEDMGGGGRGGRFSAASSIIYVSSQLSGIFPIRAYTLPVRIFGFKLRRYAEWCRVLRIEFGRVTFRDKLRLVATILRSIRLKRDKEFRRKYRCCCRCVLYDRNLRRCRPFDDSNAGCGCYMPFKIAFGGGCWINEAFPDEENIGWKRIK